jgi:pimeloyl-ACP methyl ester carboxylesterase
MLLDPPGKHNVTLTMGTLTDYTRHNTDGTPRVLMLSVFQPATCASTISVPYMPNKTAEYLGPFLQKRFGLGVDITPLFKEARLPVCANDESNCGATEDYPILLFSPGWSMSRLIYSVLASAIASEGFIVITIDHPDETAVITYPDGHAIYHVSSSEAPTTEEFTIYMYPKVVDSSFIIDQLSNATAMAELLPLRGAHAFSTDRVAMLGHSLGGAASVYATGQDPRVRAAIDWDGTLFGDLPSTGVSQPAMFMSSPRPDETIEAAWLKVNGPKMWAQVANITHMGFSDALALFSATRLDAPELTALLGTIKSTQLVKMLATYTAEWMNGAFRGNIGGPLLQGDETDVFPEVSIVMKGNY